MTTWNKLALYVMHLIWKSIANHDEFFYPPKLHDLDLIGIFSVNPVNLPVLQGSRLAVPRVSLSLGNRPCACPLARQWLARLPCLWRTLRWGCKKGKRVEGNMVSGFLYSLTYQHVTIILFEQTLTPLGQRERASRDEGYSTQDGLVVTCHERSLYHLAKHRRHPFQEPGTIAWRAKLGLWTWISDPWQGSRLGIHIIF